LTRDLGNVNKDTEVLLEFGMRSKEHSGQSPRPRCLHLALVAALTCLLTRELWVVCCCCAFACVADKFKGLKQLPFQVQVRRKSFLLEHLTSHTCVVLHSDPFHCSERHGGDACDHGRSAHH
jgi:hypothetical protein